jgi:hypothetical protein
VEGEWQYADLVPRELVITNPDGSTSPISQEELTTSKKTLGIHDSPAGGNIDHLSYIKEKVSGWISRMSNGHLPSHMAWVAYKHQLWPGVRYGLGTMTNDLEAADNLLNKEDYRMLNVLGVVRTVPTGLRRLHTSFGGFGLFNLPVEQMICRVNMLMQHYHTSTNVSKKLDASIRYLQPLVTGLCGLGPSRPAFMGKDALEDTNPLRHTPTYGILKHRPTTRKGPSIDGHYSISRPRQRDG